MLTQTLEETYQAQKTAKPARRRAPATQSALAARYQRAIEGLAKGQYSVSLLRFGLVQVSKSDGTAYKVRSGMGLPVCTCPDWKRHGHGHICKHMLIVAFAAEPLTYVGFRTTTGAQVYVVRDGKPNVLRHINRHSPTGFEWGYGGSGPADLAYSILADYAGEDVADSLAVRFKEKVIARLPHSAWMLTEDALQAFLRRHSVIPVDLSVSAYA